MYNVNLGWRRSGVPFTLSPKIGTARWDGSRWQTASPSSPSATATGFNTDTSYSEEATGFDTTPSKAMLSDPSASMAGSRALNAAYKSLTPLAGNAALNAGALGLMGAPSELITAAAKSSLVNPTAWVNAAGNMVDAAFGFDTTGKNVLTATATMLGGPFAGIAANALGGFVTEGIADLRGTRSMEQVKDIIEDTEGMDYFRGKTLSADIAETIGNAYTASSGDVRSAALAGIGAAENTGLTHIGYSTIASNAIAAINGRSTPDNSDIAMGELIAQELTPGGNVLGGLAAADGGINFGSVSGVQSASGVASSMTPENQASFVSASNLTKEEAEYMHTPAQEAVREIAEEQAMDTALGYSSDEGASDESVASPDDYWSDYNHFSDEDNDYSWGSDSDGEWGGLDVGTSSGGEWSGDFGFGDDLGLSF